MVKEKTMSCKGELRNFNHKFIDWNRNLNLEAWYWTALKVVYNRCHTRGEGSLHEWVELTGTSSPCTNDLDTNLIVVELSVVITVKFWNGDERLDVGLVPAQFPNVFLLVLYWSIYVCNWYWLPDKEIFHRHCTFVWGGVSWALLGYWFWRQGWFERGFCGVALTRKYVLRTYLLVFFLRDLTVLLSYHLPAYFSFLSFGVVSSTISY